MAQNTYKSKNFANKPKGEKKSLPKLNLKFLQDRRVQLTVGFFLLATSLFLLVAFISYLFTGRVDQSVIDAVHELGVLQSGLEVENWMKLYGAISAHYFIFEWFGLASFLLPFLFFLYGYRIVFHRSLIDLGSATIFVFFFLIWISLFLGDIVLNNENVTALSFLSGGIGYNLAVIVNSLIGWGSILLLIFSLVVFGIFYFDITSFIGLKSKVKEKVQEVETSIDENVVEIKREGFEVDTKVHFDGTDDELLPDDGMERKQEDLNFSDDLLDAEPVNEPTLPIKESSGIELEVETPDSITEETKNADPEFVVKEEVKEEKADEVENYDPTLDLGTYQYPTLDLLNDYGNAKAKVSSDELEQNKDKIVTTLTNFNIGISSIRATIGPTVTLYEIVPEAGIKISKIKNLEDDIALSLSALGIRIIAPIPGKGTIGIEVPNKNREMVDIKGVLGTEKFMKSDAELPVVLGKTISNEVFMVDLAKMPHILMAGATGQGKSVGLNVLLTSLIYKKHPSQLKLVLVDPKKVELSLFNKLERHFLAKLPDKEDAIITDTKQVIHTLNSLTIEMDARYDLLKEAGTRNIKEYNVKFVKRRLNPEKGHRFLPYIVLVIDELADLMMTAGKEVETPIARLAQLARAIGIHLVVATQRPSVNVITGTIKANFPARLSFRVTSKIDSRTILDAGGADQLVGMGDMLFSQGSDTIRLQCAFVDTPEVERICDFIGEQRGYESSYLLPEFVGEEAGDSANVDLNDRDALFDDAARVIVVHQQGSTSLVQRKLKLGYNRAGRLIDQLEAAGIVGPFEGSKARSVLIPDEYSLEQLLNELNEK
ncbi:DNA translocase FtsK [hydrothermal vent metagenome]|uniref:DNA translocase FtsK n=1 Tax=hydrothermal vent metagenome TaxID=652676 RepID=A0A3B0UL73_9ZZZZ